MKPHGERKHAKFAASSAERYFNCPGSVALSEGIPPKDNIYSLEGTRAHEVLESIVTSKPIPDGATLEMIGHAKRAAKFILDLHEKATHADLMVEEKVRLDFVHPEAFGTLDYAIVEHFGTLQVLDFKYGKSLVSPVENLQFLFYALGVAHRFDWNFKRVKMWTLQPRVSGFDGYSFWEITISELKEYIHEFKSAIERVEKSPDVYVEGKHCHWCVAKAKCPIKQEGKLDKAIALFQAYPLQRRGNKNA